MRILSFKNQYIYLCLFIFSAITSQVFAQSGSNAAYNTKAAAKVKTDHFPKQIQIEGTKLALNGLGTRYKAIFKVYDMGLYTASKATTLQEVINAPGPKKLQFVALRDISTTELGQLFHRGIKENATAEQNLRHMKSALSLIEIASGRSTIATGETFSMEFVPGKGFTFFVMDKPQGQPVGDAEFFGMVLGIWLGNVPADYKLKDALLGLPKS